MTSFDTWPPIRIAGTGSFVPERVVTNAELVASGLDTTDEWIVEHTGIRERRWAPEGMTTAELATNAARLALDAADCFPDDVDLLVLATSSPDWQQPATASAVHAQLGLRPDAGVFDVNAVCSGFVYALQAGSAMLAAGEAWTTVLVVAAEHYSRLTDPADRGTRIFFGDGAGAVVLRKELEVADLAAAAAAEAGIDIGALDIDGGVLDEETAGIRSIALAVDHAGKDALLTPHGEYFQMDGPAVRAYAVPAMVDAVERRRHHARRPRPRGAAPVEPPHARGGDRRTRAPRVTPGHDRRTLRQHRRGVDRDHARRGRAGRPRQRRRPRLPRGLRRRPPERRVRHPLGELSRGRQSSSTLAATCQVSATLAVRLSTM